MCLLVVRIGDNRKNEMSRVSQIHAIDLNIDDQILYNTSPVKHDNDCNHDNTQHPDTVKLIDNSNINKLQTAVNDTIQHMMPDDIIAMLTTHTQTQTNTTAHNNKLQTEQRMIELLTERKLALLTEIKQLTDIRNSLKDTNRASIDTFNTSQLLDTIDFTDYTTYDTLTDDLAECDLTDIIAETSSLDIPTPYSYIQNNDVQSSMQFTHNPLFVPVLPITAANSIPLDSTRSSSSSIDNVDIPEILSCMSPVILPQNNTKIQPKAHSLNNFDNQQPINTFHKSFNSNHSVPSTTHTSTNKLNEYERLANEFKQLTQFNQQLQNKLFVTPAKQVLQPKRASTRPSTAIKVSNIKLTQPVQQSVQHNSVSLQYDSTPAINKYKHYSNVHTAHTESATPARKNSLPSDILPNETIFCPVTPAMDILQHKHTDEYYIAHLHNNDRDIFTSPSPDIHHDYQFMQSPVLPIPYNTYDTSDYIHTNNTTDYNTQPISRRTSTRKAEMLQSYNAELAHSFNGANLETVSKLGKAISETKLETLFSPTAVKQQALQHVLHSSGAMTDRSYNMHSPATDMHPATNRPFTAYTHHTSSVKQPVKSRHIAWQ